jgi:hypothetical protein
MVIHPGRAGQELALAKAGGKKDRYVILSPNLLELLRDWSQASLLDEINPQSGPWPR